jgi:hypothetical protein
MGQAIINSGNAGGPFVVHHRLSEVSKSQCRVRDLDNAFALGSLYGIQSPLGGEGWGETYTNTNTY